MFLGFGYVCNSALHELSGDTISISSIMSDSPTAEKDIFSFSNDRSTPPPTTSYYVPKLEKAPAEKEPLVPPEQKEPKDGTEKEDKDKDKDEAGPLGPGSNPGYKKEEEAIKKDEGPGDKRDRKDDKDRDRDDKRSDSKKSNGIDGLDGKWVPPAAEKEEEENEDQCVKCLYYSMQCCECVIV